MSKFKFKSKKKQKFNLINDSENETIDSPHIEIFSNKSVIIEGCKSISEYEENYIKLKIKKGYITISGVDFLITCFEDEKIIIKGKILSFEFCV